MIEIKTEKIQTCCVTVPGSKSYTHRILIAAALSDGVCTIHNGLDSEDTTLTRRALEQLGVRMVLDGERITAHGANGVLKPCAEPIYLGNSGTSVRLLTSVAALGEGTYRLTGTPRMQERPIQDLLDGLNQIGVAAQSINGNGCPPIDVPGGKIHGGHVDLNCSVSSQYLSSLLLIAPCCRDGLDITVVQGPVSKPYVDMTVDVMTRFGIAVDREGYDRFRVPGNQPYQAGDYTVEPDCSQASYFWAAAAVTGTPVTVNGITQASRQGDVRFTEVLSEMGCQVIHEPHGITVVGGALSAVTVDMADMPDLVPTLAVIAAFAKGTTVIENVAHLKAKESDRLSSVANELNKMGISATCSDTGLRVQGGTPHGARIDTYEDHRMAMSFAVAGLRVPGVIIKNETCVEKSFPTFWQVFDRLYR